MILPLCFTHAVQRVAPLQADYTARMEAAILPLGPVLAS